MKYDGIRKIETACRPVDTPPQAVPSSQREGFVESKKKRSPLSNKSDAGKASDVVSKRRFFPVVLKQVLISAAVVGGLALLKLIDSGFSSEVFKGVKDIVSYSFEMPGVFS